MSMRQNTSSFKRADTSFASTAASPSSSAKVPGSSPLLDDAREISAPSGGGGGGGGGGGTSSNKHYLGGGSGNSGPWLHAWYDPVAWIKTVPSCVRLGDIFADGDSKLLICDLSRKLRMYKGAAMVAEYALLDQPVAAVIVHGATTVSNSQLNRVPSVGVAAGSHIFIYRNMRPYKKWTCPQVEYSKEEAAVWAAFKDGSIEVEEGRARLAAARERGSFLTARSLDLLLLEDPIVAASYVADLKGIACSQHTLITALECLRRDSDDSFTPLSPSGGTTASVAGIMHSSGGGSMTASSSESCNSLPVVGTESGHVYVLASDCSGSAAICSVQLPSVPAIMCPVGRFDAEWRIFVACRDSRVYCVKEGDVRSSAVLSGVVIDVGCPVVALAQEDKHLWVATMEQKIHCYTARGKRISTITIQPAALSAATLAVVGEAASSRSVASALGPGGLGPGGGVRGGGGVGSSTSSLAVRDMISVAVKRAKVSNILIVGLANGEVRMYMDGSVVHSFVVEGPITALRFGSYGREENTLVVVHGKSGSITIKILKRLVDLDAILAATKGPPVEQDVPLDVPRKTKLFVEQTERERGHAVEMHRAFQKDLCLLRLNVARAYVEALVSNEQGVAASYSSSSSSASVAPALRDAVVRINATALGLGPRFSLRIELQNASASMKPIYGAMLYASCNPAVYSILGPSALQQQLAGGGQGSSGEASSPVLVSTRLTSAAPIPVLLPGVKQVVELAVLCLDPMAPPGQIGLHLYAAALAAPPAARAPSTSAGGGSGAAVMSTQPLLSAVVRMPVSELIDT